MEPTEEYLALAATPPVLMCEAARQGRIAATFISMGRVPGAALRFRCTRTVLDGLRKVTEDPRHAGMKPAAPEAAAHARLLDAMRALIGGARQTSTDSVPAYDEFTVRGGLLLALAAALGADDAVAYAPGGRRFREVRAALYEAAGVPLPGGQDGGTPASRPR
jgi:hypothetical protein